MNIKSLGRGCYEVESVSVPGKKYLVLLNCLIPHCTCPGSVNFRVCKHLREVCARITDKELIL